MSDYAIHAKTQRRTRRTQRQIRIVRCMSPCSDARFPPINQPWTCDPTRKKEPFGLLLRRLHDGLLQASLPVSYEFGFADSPVGGGVSVDRAVKKLPQLASVVQTSMVPGILGPAHKLITGSDIDLPFATFAQLADGLPRSLPLHSAGCGSAVIGLPSRDPSGSDHPNRPQSPPPPEKAPPPTPPYPATERPEAHATDLPRKRRISRTDGAAA